MAMKRALTIGINDYPTAPLRGCVHDAERWAEYFSDLCGFDRVTTLKNREAKISRVTKEIRDILTVSVPGDVVRIHFSGHGTRVPDLSDDEADGMDEALVLYDGVWLDDQISDLLNDMPNGVDLGFISDSCHSGGVTRNAFVATRGRQRFMPFPGIGAITAATRLHRLFNPNVETSHAGLVGTMNHVLLSGAKSDESAWDVEYGGQPWGAMSFHAISLLVENPRLTWKELHERLLTRLPDSIAPQTPQLESKMTSVHFRVGG